MKSYFNHVIDFKSLEIGKMQKPSNNIVRNDQKTS